jgi:hypothetical protein
MEAPTGWIWKNLLLTGEILPKIKIKQKKSKDFGGFPSPKVREIVKITKFL